MIIDEYLSLIPAPNAAKPRFVKMLRLLLEPLVSSQELLSSYKYLFDLDSAEGAQLDIVGEWVGVTRNVATPLTDVYFSFNDAALGFDKGAWKSPFDSVEGLTRLDDKTYRLLLRSKIAANNWNGTLPDSVRILQDFFTNTGAGGSGMLIVDNQDMSMSVIFTGSTLVPTIVKLVQASEGKIPLKPIGVRVDYRKSSIAGPVFGFDLDNGYIHGFDQSSWIVDL